MSRSDVQHIGVLIVSGLGLVAIFTSVRFALIVLAGMATWALVLVLVRLRLNLGAGREMVRRCEAERNLLEIDNRRVEKLSGVNAGKIAELFRRDDLREIDLARIERKLDALHKVEK